MDKLNSIRLIFVSGPTLRESVLLEPGTVYVLGRGSGSDIVLEDAAGSISRQHAELSSSQGAWYVRDLSSRNGTILNAKRLAENQPTKLTTNARLQIGAWVMRVQIGDAEPPRDSSHATLVQTLSDTDAGNGVFERVASQPLAHLASHRLATLLECSETIHASKDLHEAGQAAIHAMLESTGYARGAFVRMSPESGVIETLAFDSRTPGEDVSSVRFSQSLLDMASGGEVIRLSTTGTQRDYGQSIAELNIHSAICIPVMNSDEPIGFLYLDARGAEHGVSQDASSFGRGVARLLALTDANLRSKELEINQLSMQYDLDMAGNAQRLLLPPAQGEVGAIEYCVSMRPGRFVAGDLFGVVPLDDGRVCVFLGDVSGKGAGSAILMATTQSYIHAMLEQTTDLTRVLTKLNRHVSERSYQGMFVTMWIGILSRSADGHRCDVEFIDAGHGHWLLTRPDQDALCPTFDGGMVVGIAPDYEYSTERFTLEGDQRLVLFSDGVVEQTPPSSSDEFGLEQTCKTLCGSSACAEDVQRLEGAVLDHAQSEQLDDDMTIASVGLARSG